MSENRTSFPNRSLPVEMKDATYHLLFAKGMISYWETDANPYLNKSLVKRFTTNEMYAAGEQSMEYFKKIYSLSEEHDRTGRRRGLKPLDFTPVSYAPQIINNVQATLDLKGAALNVQFLDQVSTNDKNLEKAKIWFDNKNIDFFKQIDSTIGVETPQPKVKVKSKQDLDLYASEGGIKLSYEIAFEEALNYIFNYDNKWGKYVGKKIKEDLIVNGVAACMAQIDPVSRRISFRDCDTKNCIVPKSRYYNFKDATFFGEVVPITIMDICKGIYNTTGKRVDEKEIDRLVSGTSLQSGNSYLDSNLNNYYSTDWYSSPKYSAALLSSETRPVLDFVFLSEDIVQNPIKGKKTVEIKKQPREAELRKGTIKQEDGKYYKDVTSNDDDKLYLKVWRRGKHVIGTDIIYDYGLCYDYTMDKYGDPVRPFHVVRTTTKSLIEIIRPNLDQLTLAYMEIQSELLKGHGKTLAIDVDALTDVILGKEQIDPQSLLKIYKLDGNLYYRKTGSGLPNERGGGIPIQEMEGGIGTYLQELMSITQFHIKTIQANTGLNEIALAGNPNPEVTLGQSELALGGSNNAIAHVYNAYSDIEEEVAMASLYFLQKLAKDDEEVYNEMLGDATWESLKVAAKKDLRNVAIRITEMPTKEEMEIINQVLIQAATGGKNGNALLAPYEIFDIRKMMREGTSLSLISMILKNKIDARMEEERQAAAASLEQQGQQNQELAQMKEQMAQMTMKLDAMLNYQTQSKLQQEKYMLEQQLQSTKEAKPTA